MFIINKIFANFCIETRKSLYLQCVSEDVLAASPPPHHNLSMMIQHTIGITVRMNYVDVIFC